MRRTGLLLLLAAALIPAPARAVDFGLDYAFSGQTEAGWRSAHYLDVRFTSAISSRLDAKVDLGFSQDPAASARREALLSMGLSLCLDPRWDLQFDYGFSPYSQDPSGYNRSLYHLAAQHTWRDDTSLLAETALVWPQYTRQPEFIHGLGGLRRWSIPVEGEVEAYYTLAHAPDRISHALEARGRLFPLSRLTPELALLARLGTAAGLPEWSVGPLAVVQFRVTSAIHLRTEYGLSWTAGLTGPAHQFSAGGGVSF